jgi:hypothetical protein
MRVSRPCYDKYWRCPAWAGPGMRYAKVQTCEGGSLARVINWNRRWKWKFHRCPTCGMWIMPFVVRYVDPTNWWSYVRWQVRRRMR